MQLHFCILIVVMQLDIIFYRSKGEDRSTSAQPIFSNWELGLNNQFQKITCMNFKEKLSPVIIRNRLKKEEFIIVLLPIVDLDDYLFESVVLSS